jgi:hypothetical protein
MTNYVFVDPETKTVNEVDRYSFVVAYEPDALPYLEHSDEVFLNAADNPRFTVIPVIESFEHLEGMGTPDADLPSFDDVEAAGFDGTLRTGPGEWDWKSLALALIAEKQERPKVKVAGFLQKQEDVVLPANSVWYVRAMVNRGLKAVEDSVEECVKLAANPDENVPSWAVDQLHGAVSYNQQLLREARAAIPTSFQ